MTTSWEDCFYGNYFGRLCFYGNYLRFVSVATTLEDCVSMATTCEDCVSMATTWEDCVSMATTSEDCASTRKQQRKNWGKMFVMPQKILQWCLRSNINMVKSTGQI